MTSVGYLDSGRREWQRLKDSAWDSAMITWVPVLALALIWWIFATGLPQRLPIAVVDADNSALSRQLTRMLQASPGLAVQQVVTDASSIAQALRSGQVFAVVRIPTTLTQTIKQGQATQVTLLYNAQLGTHAGLIQRDVRTVVATLSAGIEMTARNKQGEPLQLAQQSFEPLRAQGISLFNVSLNYEQFLAAALIPALLHIFAMTAGAWSVGRELRERTLRLWLDLPTMESNAPSHSAALQALLGKLAWPLLSLGTIGSAAMMGLTHGRGWQPAGSLPWVLLALWVFLALSLAMGAVASAVSRSLRMGLSVTGFITAPAFAFSGLGYPLQSMPELAQLWARALPYTQYLRLQTEQLLMGVPLEIGLQPLLNMLVSLLILITICTHLLRASATQPATWGRR